MEDESIGAEELSKLGLKDLAKKFAYHSSLQSSQICSRWGGGLKSKARGKWDRFCSHGCEIY